MGYFREERMEEAEYSNQELMEQGDGTVGLHYVSEVTGAETNSNPSDDDGNGCNQTLVETEDIDE